MECVECVVVTKWDFYYDMGLILDFTHLNCVWGGDE